MRTVLFVSFLMGVAALPAQSNEFGVAVDTTLSHVRSEPEAFKNVKVRFTIQFASLGSISNPFFTKFTPAEYANFYAWPEEQPIWREKDYHDVFGMLFLSKSHDKLDQLYKLRTFQRLAVTGVVRNTFQGAPWIEVTQFDQLSGQLDTAVLAHLYRGEKFMEQRAWQRAVAELELVPGVGVTDSALRAVRRNLGTCFLRLGEANSAVSYLQAAADMPGPVDAELEHMLAMAKSSPEAGLDRAVDSGNLRDSERPMWEAFDGDKARRPLAKPAR
ncbi:MAG TPA: hypothetical protein VF384_06335 [Planctomycetota bacterium]